MKSMYALALAAVLLSVTAANAAITTTGDVQPPIPAGSTTYSSSSGGFVVGYNSAGTVTVDGGSSITLSTQGYVGGGSVNYISGTGGAGDLNITGTGSSFSYSYGTFQLGVTAGSSIEVQNGAAASFSNLGVGYGAGESSTLTVSNATLTLATGTLYAGYYGNGSVTFNNGAKVTLGRNVLMGQLPGSTGSLTITGAGTEVDMTSTFTASSGIRVGYNGNSTLNISNGALLKMTGVNNIVLGYNAGVAGTFNLSGGTVDLGGNAVYLGSGSGTFNFTGGALTNVGAIGTSAVSMPLVQQGGTFSAGTASSTVGTATIYGAYTESSGATLQVDVTGASAYDTYTVNGIATLAGSINMLLTGFTPSIGETFDVLTATNINTTGLTVPGYSYALVNGGTTLELTYTGAAVPEPASLGLMGLGVVGLVTRRRR